MSLPDSTAPILRRRAWKRLGATIAAYEAELAGREARCAELDSGYPGLAALRTTLQAATKAHAGGDIDRGWRCLLTAQRLELLYVSPSELAAAAVALRHEAEKLSGWRKAAVLALATVKDGERLEPEKVVRAAQLRDEHYHNEAYKDGLRRAGALWLAIVLVAVLGVLLWMAHAGYVAAIIAATEIGADNGFGILATVGMLGLLGATISAITDTRESHGPARIPELASTIRVTALRLLAGPASAIAVYFALHSDISDAILKSEGLQGSTVLILAFIAGFSERLVLRVVESVAGKRS